MFKRRRRGEKSSLGSVTATPRYIEIIRGVDGTATSYADVYRRLGPIRTVVDFLSDSVSTTPLKVYRRDPSGRPEVRDHPLAVLLRHPNPDTSARALISNLVHDVGVFGNGYWEKVRALDGNVAYLIGQPPTRVRPGGGSAALGAAYFDIWPTSFGAGSAVPRRVQREDMVHFRLYDPEDRRIGVSKIESLRSILNEEIEASRQRQGFWRNAARQDMVIERPASEVEWDEDSRDRFRADWQAKFAGAQNAGKTVVLEDGMTAKLISFSAKDAEFIEGRRFVLEAAARVYNVPVSLLSLTETSTYASQREFHTQLYTETLPPWFELIQSEIELQLLPDFDPVVDPDVYPEFNVEAKLRGSFEEQAAVLDKAVGRPYMEVAEARGRLNLPDRGDPTDHELAVPINNVALGAPTTDAAMPAQPMMRAAASAESIVALKRALDREQHALLARIASGEPFDFERWHDKLAGLAAGVNGSGGTTT